MKREFPLFVTAVVGLFMILSFFVPHQLVSVPSDFLQQCAIIIVAFGYALGGGVDYGLGGRWSARARAALTLFA